MTTLDGTTLQLNGKELMIYDAEGPLCMAGIIGSERAKVDETTQSIFLESANFSATSIARSARAHGIHTDSSFRFERSTDIEMPYIALQKAAFLIEKLAKGVIAGPPIDHYPERMVATPVVMTYSYIDRLIGKEIARPTMHAILKRLDIAVQDVSEEGFTALVPPYRTDVKRPADIVEEIIRIHGYSQVPPKKSYQDVPYPLPQGVKSFTQKERMVAMLASQGYSEMKTNSLMSHARLYAGEKKTIKIANPLSQALDTLRPTMLYTGLESIAYNLNRGNRVLKLFELGRVYGKKDDEYREEEMLSIFLAGDVHQPHWHEKSRSVALHDLYGTVAELMRYCGIPSVQAIPKQQRYYDTCIALAHGKKTYAHVGAVASHILEKMDIKVPVFFTEIAVSKLVSPIEERTPIHYRPLPQAPAVARDISLALPKEVTYTEIEQVIQEEKLPYDIRVSMTDRYQGKGVEKGQKSYTIHLIIQGKKTFREAEINKLIKRLEGALKKQLKATVRT